MREALLKKRYGIPVALLLVLLLSGTVLAWYCFTTIDSTTTVLEPLSTENEEEFSANMYPGEENTWSFDIVNSAEVDYSVRANLTFTAPDGVSITEFKVGIHDETEELLDDNSTTFDIRGGKTISCSMTITAAEDAAPGEVSVSLDLSRE